MTTYESHKKLLFNCLARVVLISKVLKPHKKCLTNNTAGRLIDAVRTVSDASAVVNVYYC